MESQAFLQLGARVRSFMSFGILVCLYPAAQFDGLPVQWALFGSTPWPRQNVVATAYSLPP